MWNISSDLQEAFVEFEVLYRQFQLQPIQSFESFRTDSEVFTLSGLKLLMAFAESRNPQHLEPLAVGCQNANYLLTKLRMSNAGQWSREDLTQVKKYLLTFFELAFAEPGMS